MRQYNAAKRFHLLELAELRDSGKEAELVEGLGLLAAMLADAASFGQAGFDARDPLPHLEEAYQLSAKMLAGLDEATDPTARKRRRLALAAQVGVARSRRPIGFHFCFCCPGIFRVNSPSACPSFPGRLSRRPITLEDAIPGKTAGPWRRAS